MKTTHPLRPERGSASDLTEPQSYLAMHDRSSAIGPLAMRLWFPRIEPDREFDVLCAQFERANVNRVYLIDNGYMDNYQLAADVLAERVSVLGRRIAQLKAMGIIVGINSGSTIGHGGIAGFAESWHGRLDMQWWIDADGSEAVGIACPIGGQFLAWVRSYFAQLASIGAQEIFIDDDLRPWNHAPVRSCIGCLCPLHLQRFNHENNLALTREDLVAQISLPIKGAASPIQRAWQRLLLKSMLDVSHHIQQAVQETDPSIRLGHMSAQNFILPFGAEGFRDLVEAVSAEHRPLLRTHDFHGSPRQVHPGSALYVRQVSPTNTEHIVEIENRAHNFGDFVRSPRETRYAILTALATGMGGATLNILANDPPATAWEQRYFEMLAESDGFFRTVSQLTRDAIPCGIPVRHPAYNQQVDAIDHSCGSPLARLSDEAIAPDRLLSVLGLPFEWVEDPALLTGWLPRALGKERVAQILRRGALVDAEAARAIDDMGLGDLLGVRIGKAVRSYTGIRFEDPAFCGRYAGQHVPLRRAYTRVYHLDYDPTLFVEATTLIRAHQCQRLAPGVVVRRSDGPRIAVTPYVMPAVRVDKEDEQMILVTYQHRYLMMRLLSWVMGKPLPVWVDGPAYLSPYFLERPTDGSVVLSLFNPLPDELMNLDIVFGDERLKHKSIRRVAPSGELLPWNGPLIRWGEDGGVLRFESPETLPGCDVTVLLFR